MNLSERNAVTLYVGTMNTMRTIWLCCRGSTKLDRCSTILWFVSVQRHAIPTKVAVAAAAMRIREDKRREGTEI